MFSLRASKDPQSPGWTIEVRPKGETNPEVEFSWITTPPYRFFNPRYLEASYGYSARQIVEMNHRNFSFVLDRADHDRGLEAVLKLLWPANLLQTELDDADKTLADLRVCRGSLWILDSRISAVTPAKLESIEWLKFEVELCP